MSHGLRSRNLKHASEVAQPLDYSLAGASAAGASAAGASAAGASAAGAGVSTAGAAAPEVTLLSLPVTFESVAGAGSTETSTDGWAGGSQPTVKATTTAARTRMDLFIGGTP